MAAAMHTPGPWRASPSGTFVENGKPHGYICHLNARGGSKAADVEMLANARLLAAAPDMLAALKHLLPLAGAYLRSAPTHPDNAKLEDAREAIRLAETGGRA